MMPLYVHFGAGNIKCAGRADFSRAGYQVLFVDAVPEIVRALHERREYRVVIKDTLPPGTPDSFMVTGVDGVDVRDQEAVKAAVARADLIGTAVGAAHLPSVLNAIAAGLPEREGRPVSLLFCENLHGLARMARETLSRALPEDFPLDQQVGLVETSIGKMVPLMPQEVRCNDPLEVWGEAYNAIIADRNGFVGPVPDDIEGLLLKQCFQAYVDRKLYIHNLGHATCAYHGYLRGHALVDVAMCDPAVYRDGGGDVVGACAGAALSAGVGRRWIGGTCGRSAAALRQSSVGRHRLPRRTRPAAQTGAGGPDDRRTAFGAIRAGGHRAGLSRDRRSAAVCGD